MPNCRQVQKLNIYLFTFEPSEEVPCPEDEVAEIRMLRWMCGHTRKERIRNEVIRDNVGVASMEDKLQESRLRWFGHVKSRDIDAPVRRYERLSIAGRKGRDRPKKYWGDVVRQDMSLLQLTEDMTHDKKVWRVED